MDIPAEIAARVTGYLEIMADVVELAPPTFEGSRNLADFKGWQTLGQEMSGPWPPEALRQRAVDLVRLRQRYVVLQPGQPVPAPTTLPDGNWFDFCLHAQQLSTELLRLTRPPAAGGPAIDDLLRHRDVLPQLWRRQLRRYLHQQPQLCETLARCLDFTPRLLLELFHDMHAAPPTDPPDPLAPPRANSAALLVSPRLLQQHLRYWRSAVPFAYVFAQELEDLALRRRQLEAATAPADEEAPPPPPVPPRQPALEPPLSPWDQARDMDLFGLCLSGGGIRSASFNVGVLQALSTAGGLPRLDYLSTVSGGGYAGSWLVAWIKRLGSVTQVQRVLDARNATNPRSEELRPIRWLRSYSNYLAPEATAFSVDMWTVGVTWLRNTLLNQVVLMLALCAALTLPYLLLLGWLQAWQGRLAWAAGGLLLAGLLTGCGMVARVLLHYQRRQQGERVPGSGLRTTMLIVGSILLVGYLASAYAYRHAPALLDAAARPGFWLGVLAVLLTGMLVVAFFGRYLRNFAAPPAPWAWHERPWTHTPRLVLATLLSAAFGTGLLWGATRLLAGLAGWVWLRFPGLHTLPVLRYPAPQGHVPGILFERLPADAVGWSWVPGVPIAAAGPWLPLAFVLGLPLIVEALALMVTLRMGLLGRHVPDDRREWWGRLGALVQLLLLSWLVFTGMALLAPVLLHYLLSSPNTPLVLPVTVGGWLLLVGKGVQWAQSGLTPAQADQTTGPRSSWRDLVARAAPYVFALGLLLLVSWLVAAALPPLTAWLGRPQQPFSLASAALLLGGSALLSAGLAYCLGVNEFSMHHFYRNRLVRAYLAASRPTGDRRASPFTGFDLGDDLKLDLLRPDAPARQAGAVQANSPGYDGPLPILGAALNVTRGQELANQDRQAEAFVFTPRYCGFDFARERPGLAPDGAAEFGYRPTPAYAYPGGPALGTAMTISGAAANPNMGYHSSPVTAFLMTMFNVRLGWWMGNPRSRTDFFRSDPRSGLFYLLYDLLGRSTADRDFVSLSDGGHFDNLGLYELVRRRCRYIIVSDAEEDEQLRCEGLANAIRRCRIDFGVDISLDVRPVQAAGTPPRSATHYVHGRIHYPDWPPEDYGHLLYLKSSLTGEESIDILHYAAENPTFPHQSTGDQFFTEAQLESYRALGCHVAREALAPLAGEPFALERLFAPDPAPLHVHPNGHLRPVLQSSPHVHPA